jgi:hypothetical protein
MGRSLQFYTWSRAAVRAARASIVGGFMRSWIHDVRWVLLGTLVLSACGGSSDGGELSGNGGGGGSGGGVSSSGGSASQGPGGSNASGGSNTSGTTSGTGNVTGGGDGGSSTGTGGAQNGTGGASKGNGGTDVGVDGGDVDGGDVDGGVGGRSAGGGKGGSGAGGRPASCPMRAPANLTTCTMAEQGTECTYGAEMCTCTMQGNRLDWRCMRSTGGAGGAGGAGGTGNATNCPMSAPMSGGMCTRATRPGQSNTCRYGTDECTCGGVAAMSTWTCLTCPDTEPMPGGMCSSAGTCTYTARGRTTLCTCRAPIRGAGGAGGASMTWACF